MKHENSINATVPSPFPHRYSLCYRTPSPFRVSARTGSFVSRYRTPARPQRSPPEKDTKKGKKKDMKRKRMKRNVDFSNVSGSLAAVQELRICFVRNKPAQLLKFPISSHDTDPLNTQDSKDLAIAKGKSIIFS